MKVARLAFAACLPLAACARTHGCGESDASLAIDASLTGARSTSVIRRDGNALVGSTSTYLLEHAHDPVDWHPWNDATLALAATQKKPIFLSIGYAACHFCHVMHDEVFDQDDVAAALNARFISIKVDREERPDIDAVYIAALERIAGSAGWPANLFLSPDTAPFFGVTYLPHDRFLTLVAKAADAYDARDASPLGALDIHTLLGDAAREDGAAIALDDIRAIAVDETGAIDPIRGGRKGNVKFPMAPRLRFLLHACRQWDLPDLTKGLRATLDIMQSSALHDPVSNGFHRYTTDPSWTTPHYEEMLYDQAQLALLYLEASAAFNEPRYLETSLGVLDFLERDMKTANGAFAASFDADTAGKEGAAWRWSASEIAQVVGNDAPIVTALLGVGEEEGAPRLASFDDTARAQHTSVDAVLAAWHRSVPLLRAARAGVARRDDKIVAAWNGLAIRAFSAAFLVTGTARYRDAATHAGDAIWSSLHAGATLTRTPDGVPAFAADIGDLAAAYLSVFESTADLKWLVRAEALLGEAHALEIEGGGWYDGASALARTISFDDGVEPSGSAAILEAFERRDELDRDPKWSTPVARALGKYGNALRTRSMEAPAWLDAAMMDEAPTYEVVLAGSDSRGLSSLDLVIARLAPSWASTVRVASRASTEQIAALPGLAQKESAAGQERAFVCDRTTCKAPTSDPSTLRRELLGGWRR